MAYVITAPTCARRSESPKVSLVQGWFDRAKRRRDARVAMHRLRSLDDHLLRDMGIDRRQIEEVTRNGRRR